MVSDVDQFVVGEVAQVVVACLDVYACVVDHIALANCVDILP